MNMAIFVILIPIMCAISSLLTEAIKKVYQNAGKEYSANLIALINAVVVGGCGTAAAYILMGIAFTLPNIVCLLVMASAVWLGSMIGYDKVIQLVAQLSTKKM